MVPAQDKLDKPARLSAEDWAVAALDVIAESGLAAVAVEPLAKRLGVTKGSFYWHFPSRGCSRWRNCSGRLRSRRCGMYAAMASAAAS